jgi:hypothetical protein
VLHVGDPVRLIKPHLMKHAPDIYYFIANKYTRVGDENDFVDLVGSGSDGNLVYVQSVPVGCVDYCDEDTDVDLTAEGLC